MNLVRHFTLAVIGAAAAVSTLAADLKVGFITSLSGPVSSLGIPYAKGIQAGQAWKSEVAGHKIQLVQLDDGSDPATSARNARKLINEDKVDVIIGTAGSPGSLAIAAVARETKTPLISIANANLAGEEGAWMVTLPQPAPLMVGAVVERMKKSGVKTVGYIGFSDAWGDLVYDALTKAAEPAGIKVVTNERYARADTSVTGQVLKIVAAHPDAVGAISEADHANSIIAAGRADLCAVARPHLANPAWTLMEAAKIGYVELAWPKQYRAAKMQLERDLERRRAVQAQVAGLSPLEQANRALGV